MKFEFGKRAITITPELEEHYLAWHKHYAPKCGGGIKLSNHCRHWNPFLAGGDGGRPVDLTSDRRVY